MRHMWKVAVTSETIVYVCLPPTRQQCALRNVTTNGFNVAEPDWSMSVLLTVAVTCVTDFSFSCTLRVKPTLLCPDLRREGHYKMMGGVRLSICFMCFDLTRERKNLRSLKTGTTESHDTSNQRSYLEVKRSKVKVTRPVNAVTAIAPIAAKERL